MSSVPANQNKMGTMSVPKLLLSMSLPMMLSMMILALYNVVDSIFVAQLSEDALTAVSLAYPIQSLIIAVSVGTGVGINALLSRNLGEQNYKGATDAATNGIFLAVISALVFTLFGIFGSHFYFASQTGNTVIVDYGTSYLTLICSMSICPFLQITMERLLQSTGKSVYSMMSQITGAIINIVLDPIMIFGLFGFPRLEVTGAALATVTGQIASVLLGLYFNIKFNKEININMKGFRPHLETIRNIYIVGFPAIVMQAIGSVMTFSMNHLLLMFSTTAAAVFGIYFKLQSFIFMPVYGLNNGMVPIIAFNYGARNKKRIVSAIRLSIMTATIIMTVGLILFMTLPDFMLRTFFDASAHMIEIGVPALKIFSLSFVFAGFSIVSSAVFQSLGNGFYSLITSAIRQLVVLLPLAYIFAKFWGLTLVWWSIPIAEIFSLVLSAILLRKIYNNKIKNI